MKKIPANLLQQTIQCIRSAKHPNVAHDTVENIARQLEVVRDDGGEALKNQLEQMDVADEAEEGEKEDATPEGE